jgi:hypothetical protein
MCEIAPSTAEAELGTLFHNGKEACSVRTTLEEMGHPQPPTATGADNNAAAGIANDSIKQKRSKAMDMRFCWMRDRVQQGQFCTTWCKGAFNKADSFSKHHPTARHRDLQSAHLHEPPSCNSNCFDCLRDDKDDNDDDAGTTADDSAPIALHAQPKALRSNAAPAGEGVLNPLHAGHASHTACACVLSQSLEWTRKAAASLRSFFSSSPFVISSLLQWLLVEVSLE